jgi:hypothetical protein
VLGVETTRWPCAFTGASPANFGTATLFGIPQYFTQTGGLNPSTHVGIADSQLTVGTTITLTLYGTSYIYLMTGFQGVSGQNTNHHALIRYQ